MTAETALLAKFLVTAALIAATTEYAEIIRRRVMRRAAARERDTLEAHGLHGLVRVFLTESPPTDAALVAVRPGLGVTRAPASAQGGAGGEI